MMLGCHLQPVSVARFVKLIRRTHTAAQIDQQSYLSSKRDMADCTDQGFRYTPLQGVDEIRLLRIESRTETRRHGTLTAAIHHVLLSDPPLYTAVSWMWGPRKDLVNLEINGRVLLIQSNLGRIIQDLQEDHQARYLWIDAICIDQQSVNERNHQVKLMGRIYSNANYVVACLMAEHSNDRKKLAKTAAQVHRTFERCLKEGSIASMSASSRRSPEYKLFFENRYFTRRWIIQEIIKARSVILCCEGYQMPMSILQSMFDDSRQGVGSRNLSGPVMDLMGTRAMQFCRLRQEMDGSSLPLQELLYTHEAAECLDFRDKVYALLSLSERASQALPVRYEIRRIELMLSVIVVCCFSENMSPLHTLSFTCFLKQHLGVDAEHVGHAILIPPLSTTRQRVELRGIVRGSVKTLRMTPEIEAAATRHRIRHRVPALNAFGRVNLEFMQPSVLDKNAVASLIIVDRQPARFSEGDAPIAVSGVDQWLFAFEGDDSRPSAKAYRERPTIAGLASTRIDVGDEIWQFERTPLALVARRSRLGYILVGRAYLFKELSSGRHSDRTEARFQSSSHSRKLEDDLVWVTDAKLHDETTPLLEVDVSGLLRLMTWVNYDR